MSVWVTVRRTPENDQRVACLRSENDHTTRTTSDDYMNGWGTSAFREPPSLTTVTTASVEGVDLAQGYYCANRNTRMLNLARDSQS
jgi:hypothetical protein